MTDLFLCNIETTQYKNHFDANLVEIHPAVIEIINFRFCASLVTACAAILECQIANNRNGFMQLSLWHEAEPISIKGS